MVNFLQSHPDYLLVLGVLVFLVYKVIVAIKNFRPEDDDDQDGGILSSEPILDLPPGVSLPTGPVKERESELVA